MTVGLHEPQQWPVCGVPRVIVVAGVVVVICVIVFAAGSLHITPEESAAGAGGLPFDRSVSSVTRSVNRDKPAAVLLQHSTAIVYYKSKKASQLAASEPASQPAAAAAASSSQSPTGGKNIQ